MNSPIDSTEDIKAQVCGVIDYFTKTAGFSEGQTFGALAYLAGTTPEEMLKTAAPMVGGDAAGAISSAVNTVGDKLSGAYHSVVDNVSAIPKVKAMVDNPNTQKALDYAAQLGDAVNNGINTVKGWTHTPEFQTWAPRIAAGLGTMAVSKMLGASTPLAAGLGVAGGFAPDAYKAWQAGRNPQTPPPNPADAAKAKVDSDIQAAAIKQAPIDKGAEEAKETAKETAQNTGPKPVSTTNP